MKPKLVILDANVIIHAHENGYWTELIKRYQVYVGAIIVDESKFFFDEDNDQIAIDLASAIAKGEIAKIEAGGSDLALLEEKLVPDYLGMLHAGEREVIAYMAARQDEDYYFCTADLGAVKMMSVLDLGGRVLSTEKLCDGFYSAKKLRYPYREEDFKKALTQGLQEKGIALKKRK